MFKREDNSKIGSYISYLIGKRFKSDRQFCKAYIESQGREANNDEIRKMANRLSQIKKGTKSIQIDDLQYFTQLLEVTCEEILSAGNCFVPDTGHMTNYKFAFTKEKTIWEQYINRLDNIILNTDEYGKTVIDYALEFKNYELLKFLTDNKYIWFVGDDPKDYWMSFGAGTSIRRKPFRQIGDFYVFSPEKKGVELILAENDSLRRQMISLAIDNYDFDMLTTLHAREIPPLYQADFLALSLPDYNSYYDEQLLIHISNADNQILDYFFEEFEIKNHFGRINRFLFPYAGQLVDMLIKKKHPHVDIFLKRCIEHNQLTYERLQELLKRSFSFYEENFRIYYREVIEKNILKRIDFSENGNIICFQDGPAENGIITNIVYVTTQTENSFIGSLIQKTNSIYEDITTLNCS